MQVRSTKSLSFSLAISNGIQAADGLSLTIPLVLGHVTQTIIDSATSAIVFSKSPPAQALCKAQ